MSRGGGGFGVVGMFHANHASSDERGKGLVDDHQSSSPLLCRQRHLIKGHYLHQLWKVKVITFIAGFRVSKEQVTLIIS